MRIRFHPGVPTNAASFILTGVGVVTAANATQATTQYIGYAGMILGIGLFIWGVTIDGEHWWKVLPRFQFPIFSRGQMYVGQILAFDSQLDALHTLSLTVRGYNGTRRDRMLLSAFGSVKLSHTLNGSGPEGIVLAPPGLVDPPTLIAADSEFNINFRQPLTPEQARLFRQWESQGAYITMMFADLVITTKPTHFGRPSRLVLWDGISLSNGRFLGRIVSVTGHASARTSVTLGGSK